MKQTFIIILSLGLCLAVTAQNIINGSITNGIMQPVEASRAILFNSDTTILLAGYHAEGTNGRHLLEGAEDLKIYGKYYRVKAKVDALHVLSAYADQDELLDWLSEIKSAPQKIFITHGEPHPADALRVKISDTYGWKAEVPQLYEIVELNKKTE